MNRHQGRELAVQVLYQRDVTGIRQPNLLDYLAEEAGADAETVAFARARVAGVTEHLRDIDRLIGSRARGWSLDRLAAVDRAILRLAVFELRFAGDVPEPVAIDEAVELAKSFGADENSPRFVNGILGSLVPEEAAPSPPSPGAPAPDRAGAAAPAPPGSSGSPGSAGSAGGQGGGSR
ncbi:MAG: transcription antitermination factor NusB [Bacillota bacterium]|nr:transcription antitermination factor NusB [Bacillota bacterium]